MRKTINRISTATQINKQTIENKWTKSSQAVFVDELGADPSCLANATPKDDFGGGHADPNLTYAKDLVKAMGLTNKGLPLAEMDGKKVRLVEDTIRLAPSDVCRRGVPERGRGVGEGG